MGGGGAWPGTESTHRATHQRPGATVWRAPEGREGTGGLRDRPLRAAGSRVAISRAAGPDGARNTSGAASNKLNRKFRLHRRCGGRRRDRRARAGFEIDHSEPQARVWLSRGRPGPTAPETPAEPQATSSIANSGCTAGVKGVRGPGCGARNTSGATSNKLNRKFRLHRRCEGRKRAWLWRPWAAAEPGRAPSQRTEPLGSRRGR